MNMTPADEERLSQIQRELPDYYTALSIVEGRLQTEERLAGNRQYEAVKEEVNRLGSRLANAFLATYAAHVEYENFVTRLEDAGGNVSTLRVSPAGLVNPADRNSLYFYGLRELSEAGFLSKGDMPRVFE
jgi:hypothetical protein